MPTVQPSREACTACHEDVYFGTYSGGLINSQEIERLTLNAGRLTQTNLRNSSSRDDMAYVYNGAVPRRSTRDGSNSRRVGRATWRSRRGTRPPRDGGFPRHPRRRRDGAAAWRRSETRPPCSRCPRRSRKSRGSCR